MYSRYRILQKYIRYYFSAANGKGHGIHSPFVFSFVKEVLGDNRHYYAYDNMEYLRKMLDRDHTLLPVEDMGAGSATGFSSTLRKKSSIVRHAAKSPRLAKLLFRIANRYQANNILELGTSLGISTGYLSLSRQLSTITTIEGAPAVAEAAAQNFKWLRLHNVVQHTGDFDEVLPRILPPVSPFDMVYIDGNHRHDPTVRYFKLLLPHMASSSVMIFDDIHWSEEMEAAWADIKNDPAVLLTIDLFFLGLVFFRPEFIHKQHFIIRF